MMEADLIFNEVVEFILENFKLKEKTKFTVFF